MRRGVGAKPAMGVNNRAAKPDSPGVSTSVRGKSFLPVPEMETRCSPISISAPSCEANISEAVQSSDCEMLSKVDVPSASNAPATRRCITDLEGGAWTSPRKVEGETRMII